MYMGIGTTGYATTFFMPTILLEFHWTQEEAQVHTIPVYVVSAAGMLMVAWLSDRFKHRYAFAMGGVLISTVGYAILMAQMGNPNLNRETKYAAVFLVCLGGYIATPMALAWLANNVSGHWKRSFSSSIQITIGNFAGIIGTNIFLPRESPTYPTGYGTAFGMLWVGALAATLMVFLMHRENAKRDAGARDHRLALPREVVANLGDHHPSFRFTL
jgi:MFS family permease